MKHALIWGSLLLALPVQAASQTPSSYSPHPDSRPQPGVPRGEVIQARLEGSRVFPGTSRDYWIYVPAQYKPGQPAALYVHQDGVQFEAPTVFDNLIHRGDMPVTIGVFVGPGRVRTADTLSTADRVNRSFEYDELGDRYVRFLLEELLPDVERRRASDGRPLRLSPRAADRGIGGWSSGAIAAFNAAWERPDHFSRVFSAIGSFADIRGGDHYPALIRRFEPRPIRVFLQDGSNDLNVAWGDWWMANQTMERALTWAGYEVEHAWGDGGHNAQHPTAIFPDAMRWLWRGWPGPVGVGATRNEVLGAILLPGEGWSPVGGGSDLGAERGLVANLPHASALAISPDRTFLYAAEDSTSWIHSYRMLADGSLDLGQPWSRLETGAGRTVTTTALVMDVDGRLYAATSLGIQVFDRQGRLVAILSVPGSAVTGMRFGGEGMDRLLVESGGAVYARKLGVRGASTGDSR